MSNFLNLIDRTEGGGRYDTLFGFSNQNGPFAGTDITQMTLGQLLDFTKPSGAYGQYVKSKTGTVATPLGRYQIVGRTMRGAMQEMGLSPDTVFDQNTQDQMALHLVRRRLASAQTPEAKRNAVRSEWVGLKHVDDASVDAAIAEIEGAGWTTHGSSKGFLSQEDELIVGRNPDGTAPVSELQRIAQQAILRGEQPPLDFSMPVGHQGPHGIYQNQGALAGAEGEQDTGLLARLMPDLTPEQRRMNLLAIGAGLLSGDDWSSGFAGAGQNLLGVAQQREAQANKQQRIPDFQRVGSVMTPDGQIVGGVSYDPTNAQFFTYDPQGGRKDLPGAIPLNQSDASGSRFASMAGKAKEEAADAAATLRAVDRVLQDIDNVSFGAPGVVAEIQKMAKTMLNMGLTEAEINKAKAQGELQALIGRFRVDTVGPGVMTEQDAARVVMAMGGDLKSLTSNPEVVKARLQVLRGDVETRYNRHSGEYEMYRQQFPYMPLTPLEKYQGPSTGGVLNQSKGGSSSVEDILKLHGL